MYGAKKRSNNQIKIVLLGEGFSTKYSKSNLLGRVGKTSLALRYKHNKFNP